MPLTHALTALAGLIVLAAAAGILWRVLDGRRRRTRGAAVSLDQLGVTGARAVLVQFSTETCARCPQVRRMLQTAASALPGVAFAEIDLTHRPELATRHRILTTPTTFVLAPDGTVSARFAGVPRRPDIDAALAELPALQEA